MRILIINITRFGDTLQAQPLLHALSNQDHEIGLVCLENFTEPAQLLAGLSHLFPIPAPYLLKNLVSDKKKVWHNSLIALENFATTINNVFEPEIIINLTANLSARFLAKKISLFREIKIREKLSSQNQENLKTENFADTSLTSATNFPIHSIEEFLTLKENKTASENFSQLCPVLGFGFHGTCHRENTNIWATYIEAVTLNRISSPYNLSDGFTLLAGESLLKEGATSPAIAELNEDILKQAYEIYKNLPLEDGKKKSEEAENNNFLPNENLNSTSLEPVDLKSLVLKSKEQVSKNIKEDKEKNEAEENVRNTNLLHVPTAVPLLLNSEESEKEYNFVTTNAKIILLQLGASANKRQWAVEHFSRLSQIFVNKGYVPVIVGTSGEVALAEEFYEYDGIAKNAVGKTSILTLGGLLKQSSLLVTNDTGTMHLAAALEVPIIGIFIATAQPWDTGAVSTDACFIEPNLSCHPCNFSFKCQRENVCKTCISPEMVGEIADKRLKTGEWQHVFSEKARVWKSVRDKNAFLMLEPLDILEKNSRLSFFNMQRVVFKALLDRLEIMDKEENSTQVNEEFTFSLKEPEFIEKKEREKLLVALENISELFFLLLQQGKLIHSVPKMSQAFLSTNQRIQDTYKAVPVLVPLAYIWAYGMEKYGASIDTFFVFIKIIQQLTDVWKKELTLKDEATFPTQKTLNNPLKRT